MSQRKLAVESNRVEDGKWWIKSSTTSDVFVVLFTFLAHFWLVIRKNDPHWLFAKWSSFSLSPIGHTLPSESVCPLNNDVCLITQFYCRSLFLQCQCYCQFWKSFNPVYIQISSLDHAVTWNRIISELWPFCFYAAIPNQCCSMRTWRPACHVAFFRKGYKDWGEQSSFLDVERINGTSCSDFMKVAFPLLKVYKVGKNSSVNIIFKDKENW